MATPKTKTTAPKTTTFPAENISESYHTDYNQVLTVTTIMTKPAKGRASFEFEIHLNGDMLGVYPDRSIAEREVRAAAMAEIEKIQTHRALVAIEAAAGVPEAIEEINASRAQRRVIAHIPFTDQFGLYLNGSSEPLLTGGSYLEVEHAARNHYDLDPLPF